MLSRLFLKMAHKHVHKKWSFLPFALCRVMIQKLKALCGTIPITLIKRRSFRFQRLLKNYGEILELLDDAAEKQGGGFVLDKQYLVALTNKLFDLADTMVYDLNVLTREQHLDFYDMLDRFKKETRELISDQPAFLQSELVIPLPGVKEFLPQQLGSKNASLLDLHQQLGITVPEGFAITYSAHQRIIETNRLGDFIKTAIDKFQKNDPVATKELLAVQEKLRSATLPSELREEIYQALTIMTEKFGNDLMLTMDFTIRGKRLDSKGSGGDYTKTVSTIKPDKVCDLYREELTNFYDPAQVYFRQMKRINATAYLAAVCKRMIRGKAAGKLYTLDPAAPFSKFMVLTIRANRDDQNTPRAKHRISRHSPWEIIPFQNPGDRNQKKNDISSLSTGQQDDGCLISCDAIATLIKLGLRIERYFQQAQEIEWIQNDDDSFIIRQVQPLEKTSIAGIDRKFLATALKKYRVLYDNVGTVACRGIGCGPVFLANHEEDLKEFPEQGVLIIADSLPEEAQTQVMQRATAILIDSGKITDPMVSHARFFHVPCITGLGDVTKRLASGSAITVDADENVVYEGQIDELVNYNLIEGLGYEDAPEYQMFRIIQDKITPLTLTNLVHPEFTISACRTIHDLTHLAYENAVMGLTNQELYRKESLSISKRLAGSHNLTFQVIDIGDGLKQEKLSGSVIGINDLQCRPLFILWEALGAPDRGGDSLPPHAALGSNGLNTALVSKEYLNLVMHVENLIDMIDCFICEENDLNYIFCRFSERAHQKGLTILFQEVMRRLDLKVKKTSKALHAWLSGLAPQAMEERLRFIGHLIVFTRISDQMALKDMSLEDQCNFFFTTLPQKILFR